MGYVGGLRPKGEEAAGGAGCGDGYVPIKDEPGGHLKEEEVEVPTTCRASLLVTSANIVTAGLGSAILSLPWAMAGSSILLALGITLLVLLLNAWTLTILTEAAERLQTFNLGGLLGHLAKPWGPRVQVFCDAVVWASISLCLVGYMVIVADALGPWLPTLLGDDVAAGLSPTIARCAVVGVGTLWVLPLCFLRQKYLGFSSGLSILVNVYLFGMLLSVLFRSGVAAPTRTCLLGFSDGGVTMMSVLMQAVVIQVCSLQMYEQLEDRSPQRFRLALSYAFGFLFLLLTGFAVAGYLAYGPEVSSNVINNLPHNPPGNLARVGITFAVLGVYPIILQAMVAPIRQNEEKGKTLPALVGDEMRAGWLAFLPGPKTSVATLTVVLVTSGFAVLAPDLGFLNVVNGAAQVCAMVGLAPGFIGLHLLGREGDWRWRCAMYALILFSALMSVVGLVYTDNDASALLANCLF